MTPTREQLQSIANEIGTVADVLGRKSQRNEDENQAIRRLNDWRSRILAALTPPAPAPMPPIEKGDWVQEDGEKDATIVREAHQAKSLSRGIRRSGILQIRKANGTVWTREPRA